VLGDVLEGGFERHALDDSRTGAGAACVPKEFELLANAGRPDSAERDLTPIRQEESRRGAGRLGDRRDAGFGESRPDQSGHGEFRPRPIDVNADRDGAQGAVASQTFGSAEGQEHEQADEERRRHGFGPGREWPRQYNGKTLIPRFPRPVACVLALAMLAWGGACRQRDDTGVPRPDASAGSLRTNPPTEGGPALRPRVVALGDSLTAGLGLPTTEAYPAVLQQRIDAAGYRFEVVNAGVSGDTSAGGLSRLDWSLDGDVRVLIVALGGNDALRGLPPDEVRQNLEEILRRARLRHVEVLLAGMESPTNMGPDYRRRFHEVFPQVARDYQAAFLPFLLDGVAGRPDLNQRDGIHPTADGARVVADHIWRVLEPMLRALSR
jgi:acyl-CoA thioesterase I